MTDERWRLWLVLAVLEGPSSMEVAPNPNT